MLRRFRRAGEAVYRCTCPSRQFPCKHSLGLLYAFAQGKPFSPADVPEELTAKREKSTARMEKKKAAADKPRKVNKSALAKKIKAQLARDRPAGKADARPRPARHRQHERQAGPRSGGAGQAARQRLFARRPGGPAQLHEAVLPGATARNAPTTEREAIYSEALDQLGRLHALVRKGGPI